MSLNERGTQRGPGVANMSKWGANKAGDPSSSSSSSAVAEDAPENSGCASVDKCMEMLCMAESYALERVRTQYMSHLMRLTRIFLLLRKGEVMQAYSLCDSSEHSLMQFASATNNEFHANHIKVHFLVLKMIALISRGKVSTINIQFIEVQMSCCRRCTLSEEANYYANFLPAMKKRIGNYGKNPLHS